MTPNTEDSYLHKAAKLHNGLKEKEPFFKKAPFFLLLVFTILILMAYKIAADFDFPFYHEKISSVADSVFFYDPFEKVPNPEIAAPEPEAPKEPSASDETLVLSEIPPEEIAPPTVKLPEGYVRPYSSTIADTHPEIVKPHKPVFTSVDESYFDDAVFIGDSRMRSLELYSGLDNATFLATTGMSIWRIWKTPVYPSGTFNETKIQDYLKDHKFKKIYIKLGINELGTGTASSFAEEYKEVLDTLMELQPDAIIYVQSIMRVSRKKDAKKTYINNAEIDKRNAELKKLCDNKKIFFLDENTCDDICDENGYLREEITFDGVHLNAKNVYVWVDWLKEHAVKM